jgi:5-methylcytosine-specific restriction protein A
MPTRHPVLPITSRQTYPRPSPSRRGYDAAWGNARRLKLATDPFCEAPGCDSVATEVDHVVSMARGGTHDPTNLKSLCKPCHSRKTNAMDGGLGRTLTPQDDRSIRPPNGATAGPTETRGG